MKKVIIVIFIITLIAISIYFIAPLRNNSNENINPQNIITENPNSASAPIQKIVIPENTENGSPQISGNNSLVLDLSDSN